MRGRRRRVALAAIGPRLHQLDVVVAERPEERLRALERAGVVVGLEGARRVVDERAEPGEHRTVERLGDGAGVARVGGSQPEDEARHVEELDGEATAHLHLTPVEGHVLAGPATACPVAHCVGPVLADQGHGLVGRVGVRLRELLAIGVEHEAGDGGVGPRERFVHDLRAHDRVEEPGADDVVGLRAQVHREHPREEIGVVVPAADDLGRERRGGPRVHHVGVAGEPARLFALRLGVAVGHVGRRIDGQPRV